nr:DHHW family protein [Clostridium sp. CM74B_53]
MTRKRIGPIIIIIAFCVIICFPWLLWIFFEKYVDSTNHENREMRTRPRLTLDTYGTFSKEYDAYFNDSIPFRNNLITLNSAIDYFCFNKSTNDSVIVGKDNWLFYSKVSDGDPLSCYLGTNLYSKKDLAFIAENLVNQRNFLQEQGVEFVLFIAPNKERIYYDAMPDQYGKPADMYATRQLVEYLRNYTDLRVVYPYDELMNARNLLYENIYYKTDTHWNDIGGYIGSQLLLNELGIKMPSIDDLNIELTDTYAGDLANMLNLTQQLKNNDQIYTVSGYNTNNIQVVSEDFFDVYSYTAENADPRRVYINRDSFSTAMRLVIGTQFKETYMRHFNSYSYGDYLAYKPDVYIYEVVERNIDRLKNFSVQ